MGFPHFTEEETGQQAAFLARPHIAGGLELGCKDVSPTASSAHGSSLAESNLAPQLILTQPNLFIYVTLRCGRILIIR